jgi:predicted  nucleic acid-binding Zn-ribbon protein
MLEMIEKLLILQDRDRKILQEQGELARIEPERQMLNAKAASAQAELENVKLRIKQIESSRKDLELEVEAKKQMIVRYANQQFQTRKSEELAAAVDEGARSRYERLVRSKGENVVVGVQHGVCGGCHMKLPPQLLVTCQAEKELVGCSNCGRILYYTRDMDLAVTE